MGVNIQFGSQWRDDCISKFFIYGLWNDCFDWNIFVIKTYFYFIMQIERLISFGSKRV